MEDSRPPPASGLELKLKNSIRGRDRRASKRLTNRQASKALQKQKPALLKISPTAADTVQYFEINCCSSEKATYDRKHISGSGFDSIPVQ
jgi:hypothetical protein